MKLGKCQVCLKVKDLATSMKFYGQLGFTRIGGKPEHGWCLMHHGDCVIGLYVKDLPRNLLTFRGGDVFGIEKDLKAIGISFRRPAHYGPDGSAAAMLEDPDGNLIFLNTAPGETY